MAAAAPVSGAATCTSASNAPTPSSPSPTPPPAIARGLTAGGDETSAPANERRRSDIATGAFGTRMAVRCWCQCYSRADGQINVAFVSTSTTTCPSSQTLEKMQSKRTTVDSTAIGPENTGAAAYQPPCSSSSFPALPTHDALSTLVCPWRAPVGRVDRRRNFRGRAARGSSIISSRRLPGREAAAARQSETREARRGCFLSNAARGQLTRAPAGKPLQEMIVRTVVVPTS
ncbi:hypothetical protein IWZ00DRAFT_511876 [Phyllosticta capitalensis]